MGFFLFVFLSLKFQFLKIVFRESCSVMNMVCHPGFYSLFFFISKYIYYGAVGVLNELGFSS